MTHEAREAGMQAALREIEALSGPVTVGKTQLIRVEGDPMRGVNS
jgi:hypothetical protein